MKTDNLQQSIEELALLLTSQIQDRIKSGPTKAYRTGALYSSIKDTVKPIATGKRLEVTMNYYGRFVNDGTRFIQPPRRFVQVAVQDVMKEIEQQIGESSVKDIEKQIQTTFD